VDLAGYERVGHLEPFPLPGGDAAAREAWRPALSLLRPALPDEYRAVFAGLFPEIPEGVAALVDDAIDRGLNYPMT
jgi:hydrogenase maturation protein HypF